MPPTQPGTASAAPGRDVFQHLEGLNLDHNVRRSAFQSVHLQANSVVQRDVNYVEYMSRAWDKSI